MHAQPYAHTIKLQGNQQFLSDILLVPCRRLHAYMYVCVYTRIMRIRVYTRTRIQLPLRKNIFVRFFLTKSSCTLSYVCVYAHNAWALVYAHAYPSPTRTNNFCQIFSAKNLVYAVVRVCVCTYVRTGPRTRIMRAREPTKNVRYFCHIFCKIFIGNEYCIKGI